MPFEQSGVHALELLWIYSPALQKDDLSGTFAERICSASDRMRRGHDLVNRGELLRGGQPLHRPPKAPAPRLVADIGTAFSNAADRAGLKFAVCLYDIRHLWITTMLDTQVEVSAIAHLAGISPRMIIKNTTNFTPRRRRRPPRCCRGSGRRWEHPFGWPSRLSSREKCEDEPNLGPFAVRISPYFKVITSKANFPHEISSRRRIAFRASGIREA